MSKVRASKQGDDVDRNIMKRSKLAVLVLGLAALATSLGCAGVKPYQREFLADRIMDPAANRWEMASERKMLSTREGASGGALGTGGGCACN